MGMSANSGITTAQINEEVNTQASTKTVSTLTITGTSAATTNSAAVGAGKKWTVIGFTLEIVSDTTLSKGTLKSNGQDLGVVASKAGTGSPGHMSTNGFFEYERAPTLAEGQVLSLTRSAICFDCTATVHYIEETV